jgi:acyl dehydratase
VSADASPSAVPPIEIMGDVRPFAAGLTVRTRRRTLTDGDFAMLINATWEDAPLHTDDVYAATTKPGRRILGGPCLLAVAAGLSTETMYAMWGRAGLECITALGIDTIRYHAPVFPNDTVQLEMHIAELEPTPHGSALVCLIRDRVVNQDEQVTMTMERRYLLKRI